MSSKNCDKRCAMTVAWVCFLATISACKTTASDANVYESASAKQASLFRRTNLPLLPETPFTVSQGAFGKASHSELGNEYNWDFDVPVGTPVISVDDGSVYQVYEPNKGHKCDQSYSGLAHNIKVIHNDGSVAQYVHVSSRVVPNQKVRKGEVIAVTALNGWVCTPQLHFGIYRSIRDLYPNSKTLPLFFNGVPGGILMEGFRGNQK